MQTQAGPLIYHRETPLAELKSLDGPLPFPTQVDGERLLSDPRWLKARFTTHPDSQQHFSMVLRRGWIPLGPRTKPEPDGLLTLEKLVLRHGSEPLHLSVQTLELKRELSPADWLNLHLAEQPGEVLHLRQWLTEAGLMQDMLLLIKTLGEPWLTRLTALKDGNRLFFLRAWCSRPLYELYADDFCLAFHSFALLEPQLYPCAEPLEPHRLEVGEHALAMVLQTVLSQHWKPWKPPTTPEAEPWPWPRLDFHDPSLGARLSLGLCPREAESDHLDVLLLLRAGWQDPGWSLSPHATLHGPYLELPAGLTGHYYEYDCAPLADEDRPNPTEAEKMGKLKLVMVVSAGAYGWVLLRPPPVDAPPLDQAVARRALELALLYLQLDHPSQVPAPVPADETATAAVPDTPNALPGARDG